MKKYLLLIVTLIVTLASCIKESDQLQNEEESSGEIILQERNPNLSTVVSKRQRKPAGTRSVDYLPAAEYLGYSYRIGNADIGDNINVGHSVMDVNRLKKNHATYVSHHSVRAAERGHKAYSDYERYTELNVRYKKVNAGFKLNLGLFKLGCKQEVETRFTTFGFKENDESLGEYWFEIYRGRHSMQRSSAATRNIASNYLHMDFLDVLYNASKTELLNDYGPFVITDYYSGGRARVLFYGLQKKQEETSKRENKMGREIEASVSWKDNDNSAEGNLSVGKQNSDSSSILNVYKKFLFTLRTRGGSYTIETPTQPVVGNTINMSPWLTSLNDTKTHTLSGFVDDGLSFIGDFILEENFREILQDTHLEERYVEQHVLPRMEILKVFVRSTPNGESLYEVAPILRLRENEWLIMSDGKAATATDAELRANNNNATFMAKAQAIYSEKSKYYQCQIITSTTKTINPILKKPLSFQINGLEESRMKKFYNPNTDMYYIYDPVALVAFAYFMDDYILESYGLLEWAENLPEKAISMTNLAQRYRIFGL